MKKLLGTSADSDKITVPLIFQMRKMKTRPIENDVS